MTLHDLADAGRRCLRGAECLPEDARLLVILLMLVGGAFLMIGGFVLYLAKGERQRR